MTSLTNFPSSASLRGSVPSCDWSQALSLSPNLQTALTEFAPLITAMTAIESMAAAGMDLLLSRRTAGG